jgi:YidC/Oxa1 family membrane protein insertase
MRFLFNTFVYEPLYNVLVVLIDLLPWLDLGLIVIVFTLVVKLVLLPLSLKAVKAQKAMRDIEPEVRKLREKYKNDQQKQALKLMELYRERQVRPFASIGLILIQLPIIFALYYIVSLSGLPVINNELIYSFISVPSHTPDPIFLGLIDIVGKSLPISLLAGITQFFQTKLTLPQNSDSEPGSPAEMAQRMTGKMMYIFPIIVVFISYSLSAAVALYWATSNIFQIFQELYVRRVKHIDDQTAIAYDI